MDLPSDLTLPLSSGAPWWYWLGGRPAFDFVNTHRERWWRNVETLVTADDLSTWLSRAGLTDEPVTVSGRQLRAARRLREAIDAGIVAATESHAPPSKAMAEINRWLPGAALPRRLELDPNGVAVLIANGPADPIDHALSLLAHDAATVLATEQRVRARICASESCSARFFDASRAGSRRWCSMAACGNNAKARRHRARHPAVTRSVPPG